MRGFPKSIELIRAFLDNVEMLPVTARAAREAGVVRAELESQGQVIGAYDLLIAGHSRCIGATLVTNDAREFSRVRDLRVETWT